MKEAEAMSFSTTARFSPCRTWRYELWRRWGHAPVAAFIGLNPSTADETQDDPTIRRCIGFAKRWGYGGLVMLNLFAYRSTDPRGLKVAADPVGPENDETLLRVTAEAGCVIAAWGAHGALFGRDAAVRRLLAHLTLDHLGLTKAGHPRHPLYLARSTPRRTLGAMT